MGKLVVFILTRNEEIHIHRCIQSVAPIATRIVVVDSFSNDKTTEIAEKHGAQVFQRQWINYSDQFQWALDNHAGDEEWVMRMDSDEYLDARAQNEIIEIINSKTIHAGFYIRRKVYYNGKWMKHGGTYPQWLLRLWRNRQGRIEQRWMDEHIVLANDGSHSFIKGHVIDDNMNGITFWIGKCNNYSSREMIDALNSRFNFYPADNALSKSNDPQAKIKRIIKNHIYAHLPPGLRAALYFAYRYIILLGFLDGVNGFYWHFLQGFWYRLVVDIKISELIRECGSDRALAIRFVQRRHGITFQ